MQWVNDVLNWFSSDDGQRVVAGTVLPFIAIITAGIVAAMIGRGSLGRVLAANDRENRVAAVATILGAARRASVWNTLSSSEQSHADHVASEADVRIRLLAVPGARMAADWAAHEILDMKKNSVSFSFQAEQSLIEFRERLIEWQARPQRAKRLFRDDLEQWSYEDAQTATDIMKQQQAWAAGQAESGQNVFVPPRRTDAADANPSDGVTAQSSTDDRRVDSDRVD